MKTIIFGGAFDPVHSEHVSLAKAAVETLGADRLVLVPTFAPGHKSAPEASFSDRVEMLKLAFSDFPVETAVSDVEYQSGTTNYACEVIPKLKKLYGDCLYLVGGDSLEHFDSWKNPADILNETTLVADGREGFGPVQASADHIFRKYGKKVIVLDHVGKKVSSGDVRARLYLGDKPDCLDERVYRYISNNGVYGRYDAMIEKLKGYLTDVRFYHSKCVALLAVHLNSRHNLKLDFDKVFTAAVLHDAGKYVKGNIDNCPADALGTPVEHQFVGEYVARHDFGITDEEVLSAIACHTTGKPNMSLLDKLIYSADVVSYERNYDGAVELRAKIFSDFEGGFRKILYENLLHVKNSGNLVYPLTEQAVRFYEEN